MRLVPWSDADFPLLQRLMGDPAMTEHLGGPETPEKLATRQARYVVPGSGMFTIRTEEDDGGETAIGSVGFWEREWDGEQVYEVGWSVLPEFQGRGIATRATTLAIGLARAEGKHRRVHAFPSVDNPASNALCRRLGFVLCAAHDFEYPPGSFMRCNDWRLDLR